MRFARILLLSCYMTTPYTGALAQYTPGLDCLDSEYADATRPNVAKNRILPPQQYQ